MAIGITACGGGSSEPDTTPPPGGTPPAEPPTLTFAVDNTSVVNGSSVTLTWSSTNANTCTATGAWNGDKLTNDSEVTSSLASDSTFQLSCTGDGGAIARSVTVTVTGATGNSLSGSVDSSLVNRFGTNKVYLFAGTVVPDDTDGVGVDAITTATVTQVSNTCGWTYFFGSLGDGNYTIAFTNNAANDNPAQNDNIQFTGTTNITISGGNSTIQNFAASNVLRVGPTQAYLTPSAAEADAVDGDVIEIDAGVYMDDIVIWRQNNITLRGIGGLAHLQSTRLIPYTPGNDRENGMGIWVTRGDGISVENIEFSGARVDGRNGAGIRAEGFDLSVCKSYFHDSENGILGGNGTVLIEYSEFDSNGGCETGFGCSHNMYILENTDRLILRHNYSHHAKIGHNVKTRAHENFILYNRIMDEANGTSSYNIDVPNGGLTYIIGNLLHQGANTDNSSSVSYGAEGLSGGRTHNLYIINNTSVNDYGGGQHVAIAGGTASVNVVNNLFVGGGGVPSGPNVTNNVETSSPMFVDINTYDYRLTVDSPGINGGANQGTGDGYSINPVYQYVHKSQRQARPENGDLDIGAHELTP